VQNTVDRPALGTLLIFSRRIAPGETAEAPICPLQQYFLDVPQYMFGLVRDIPPKIHNWLQDESFCLHAYQKIQKANFQVDMREIRVGSLDEPVALAKSFVLSEILNSPELLLELQVDQVSSSPPMQVDLVDFESFFHAEHLVLFFAFLYPVKSAR
jgi:hypothetical protein